MDPSRFRWIDQVCDDFEKAWRSGGRPLIEDYLARAHPDEQADLFADLLPVDLEYRRARGEGPTEAEYRARFPTHGPVLDAHFGGAPTTADVPVTTVNPASALPSVPGYHIRRVLGRGGMGVVYLARQAVPGRTVALKMILGGAHAGPEESQRFRAEAEAVARLQHPNLVEVFEVGEHQGLPYITLEYCARGSLARRLKGTPLKIDLSARLVAVLAGALQVAHEAGIVHRDLKPANILFTARRVPKVADFGLAKILDATARTASGVVLGTPSYMAPEQAQGKPEVGPAADIYALGAVLYECLTGKPPFLAATVMETVSRVIHDEPVPPRRLNPKVPRDLETICLKCLQKDPARRYASAAELAADLGRFEANEAIRARPSGAAGRAMRWVRRRPAVAALAAAVFAVVALGAALTGWQASAARRAAAEAEELRDISARHLMTAQLLRVEAVYRDDPEGAVTLLEDEDACPPRLRDFAWGFYRRHCRLVRPTFGGSAGHVGTLAFSPDGRTLAEGNAKGVRLWEASSGELLRAIGLPGEGREVRALAISPDGRTLAVGTDGRAVVLYDVGTGERRQALQGAVEGVEYVAFDAASKVLAAGGPREVRLWDTRTWEVQKTALPPAPAGAVAVSPDGTALAWGLSEGSIKLVEVRTGRERATLAGHPKGVTALAFSGDGQSLASTGKDDHVRVWDMRAAAERVAMKGKGGGSLAISRGGEVVAAGEQYLVNGFVGGVVGGRLGWWEIPPGKGPARLRGTRSTLGKTGRVYGTVTLALRPDGKGLAWAGGGEKGEVVHLWFPEAGAERTVPVDWDKTFAATRPDGRSAALVSADGVARVVELPGGKETARLRLPGFQKSDLTALELSPDGRHLAFVSLTIKEREPATDMHVKVWDLSTRSLVADLPGRHLSGKAHTNYFFMRRNSGYAAGFSPDGRSLAWVKPEGQVGVWDLAAGKEMAVLGPAGEVPVELTFAPDGKRVVWTSFFSKDLKEGHVGATLRLADPKTGKETRSFPGFCGGAFSPDGRTLAMVKFAHHQDKSVPVKLWDLRWRRELASIPIRAIKHEVPSVWFSPDGRSLLLHYSWVSLFSEGGAVGVLVDVPGRRTLPWKPLENCSVPVFSPDSQSLAFRDWSEGLTILDVKTGQKRLARPRLGAPLAFTDDGRALLTRGQGGLTVLEAEPPE